MEYLLPLIFVMIPLIAKLVEKKIAKGGETVAPRKVSMTVPKKVQDILETLEIPDAPDTLDTMDTLENGMAGMEELPDASPEKVKEKPLKKEKKIEKSERIDPKKLVVYSEIMKPKYLETN